MCCYVATCHSKCSVSKSTFSKMESNQYPTPDGMDNAWDRMVFGIMFWRRALVALGSEPFHCRFDTLLHVIKQSQNTQC